MSLFAPRLRTWFFFFFYFINDFDILKDFFFKKKNHANVRPSNYYFKTTEAIVHGEIFSWFSHTRGSIERFTNCSLEKTADLHLNGDIVFPNAQYLEGRYCQGFLVRITQIVLGTSQCCSHLHSHRAQFPSRSFSSVHSS